MCILSLPHAINILQNFNRDKNFKILTFLPPTETRIVGNYTTKKITSEQNNTKLFAIRKNDNSGSALLFEYLKNNKVIPNLTSIDKNEIDVLELLKSKEKNIFINMVSTHAKIYQKSLGFDIYKDDLQDLSYFNENVLIYDRNQFTEEFVIDFKYLIIQSWVNLTYDIFLQNFVTNELVENYKFIEEFCDSNGLILT